MIREYLFSLGEITKEQEIMICRSLKEGQYLNVANLNEITVLIDRSETELTEVALNSWRPGLDGPPHLHEQKEQIFYIVAGHGIVKIGDDVFTAKPGDFFFVPANAVHQTINKGTEPFEYLLYNAFLYADKEGHATYAEHVESVKETRRRQARTQNAGPNMAQEGQSPIIRGLMINNISSGKKIIADPCTKALILERNKTKRCEALYVSCPSKSKSKEETDTKNEYTLFVLSGTGFISIGTERRLLSRGDVVFVPRKMSLSVQAANKDLTFLSISTMIE
jgi:mannose-6-phosphate isomerase-like protein (cupin superfamily)